MKATTLFTLVSASLAVGTLGAFGLLAACSGSSSSDTTSPDGGSSDATTAVDGTVSASDASISKPSDGGADANVTSDSDAALDAGTDSGPPYFDAGSSVWTTGVVDAGALTAIGTPVGDSDCSFVLGTVTVGIPPTYDLYLEKKDTTAGSCTEPKGFLLLVGSVDYPPAAFLARAATDKLLVVTYDYKNNLSGSSPVFSALSQIDWVSGNKLHDGVFGLKNADAGGPPAPGMGSTYVTALTVTGDNVVVSGSGRFPGAPNNTFMATYDNFLQAEYQSASFADTVN